MAISVEQGLVWLWNVLGEPLLRLWLERREEVQHWWRIPEGSIEGRLASMKDGGKRYRAALQDFNDYCVKNGVVLSGPHDVDRALSVYMVGLRQGGGDVCSRIAGIPAVAVVLTVVGVYR